MASTSKGSEIPDVSEGRFSEKHFTPVLSSDEEDYDDYTEEDAENFPELDFTDQQLQEAVSKLSKPDYERYVELRDQYLHQYRVTGRIQTFSDLVRSILKDRFPGIPGADVKAVLELRSQLEFEFKQKRKEGEKLKDKGETITQETEVEVPAKYTKEETGVEKLTPFLAQTIKECIDISAEPDHSLLIKVKPNVPLHQALTEDELDLHEYFGEDDSDAVSEYSLISEEEDPFTPAAAKNLLSTLAENNKQQAKLQEEAARLLGRGGLPQEAAEDVFKQALGPKKKSTKISEELYENCIDDNEFHLIMCMGVRVLDEARAWRLRKKLKPKKGEFKELNPRTFKNLAEQFALAPTTVNRNYNEAMRYHKLRKSKKSMRKGEGADPEKDKEEGMDTSETSAEYTDDEVEQLGEVTTKPGEEQPDLPQQLKQELMEQEMPPSGE